jgi:Holliday junction resolvasome RuvABC ATP-dependent DNA helicase subunit
MDQDITPEVVEFVIRRLRLHPLGLTENDVSALELLARRPKGIGVAELSRELGIAQTTFSQLMEPYLRMLGLIETLSRRMLTNRGAAYLESIGRMPSVGT